MKKRKEEVVIELPDGPDLHLIGGRVGVFVGLTDGVWVWAQRGDENAIMNVKAKAVNKTGKNVNFIRY